MFEEEDDKEMDVHDLPIYQKGLEIYDIAVKIGDLITDDNKHLQHVKAMILSDAAQLTVKIAGVHNASIYDLKMEAATIIRQAARNLMVHNHSLQAFGFKETEYYQIIRDLIEEYRLLFIDWIDTFDAWDYIIDRWGLFNPPGVGPFDHDPDDDIPFNPMGD